MFSTKYFILSMRLFLTWYQSTWSFVTFYPRFFFHDIEVDSVISPLHLPTWEASDSVWEDILYRTRPDLTLINRGPPVIFIAIPARSPKHGRLPVAIFLVIFPDFFSHHGLSMGTDKRYGHNTTRHGHTDTAFLKKVGHRHVGDMLIFNNIIVINLIIYTDTDTPTQQIFFFC